ncbi:hypothetical protein ACXGQW_10335 [Wenyingzhuangia sp. IMCC45533]
MKPANVSLLKKELAELDRSNLVEIIIRLSKFKKENKELLSYLIFESEDEENYISDIKLEIDHLFHHMNKSSFFYMKKTIRKILKLIKTYSRYSHVKETEIDLLLYFCTQLKGIKPNIFKNQIISNIYFREVNNIETKIKKLHPDLQFDYNKLLGELNE